MGRIKTQLTKRLGQELFKKHEQHFSDNFAENKQIVNRLTDVSSKKLRNIIAGYVTRLVKNKEVL